MWIGGAVFAIYYTNFFHHLFSNEEINEYFNYLILQILQYNFLSLLRDILSNNILCLNLPTLCT